MDTPHPFPSEIRTSRLILRRPDLADAAGLHEAVAASFAELSRWMVWARGSYSVDDAQQYCAHAKGSFDAGVLLPTLIRLPEDGTIIGSAELTTIDAEVPSFEIGYWIHTSYSGFGYVTEAAHALTSFAFEKLASNRVQIRIDEKNHRSWAIPKRLGYELEATLTSYSRDNLGELAAYRVYAMFNLERLRPLKEIAK